MIVLWWLLAVASAATWSEPLPASATVVLVAGQAARLEVEPADAPVQVLDGGLPVELRGTTGGYIVPAQGRSRVLEVFADPEVRVLVRVVDHRGAITAWDRWFGHADVWIDPGPPPNGSERLRASVVLRGRAITFRPVRRLGTLHDTVSFLPPSNLMFRDQSVLESQATEARGPGSIVVAVQPLRTPDGGLARVTATVTLDGAITDSLSFASTGLAPTTFRTWLPPGRHTVSVGLSGAPATVNLEIDRIRPRIVSPFGLRSESDVSRAELAFLEDDRDAAVQGFRALVDRSGPAGELARARLVLLSPDLDEVAANTVVREGTSPEGIEVLAHAVLRRASELPVDLVRDFVLTARDPDPLLVARWLDTQVPGLRPAGVALLDRAPDVPLTRSTRIDAVREIARATRAQRLAATTPGTVVQFGVAPGIPRARVGAGERADLTLPARADNRVTVVRLLADGPTAWHLDGVAHTSPGGRVDIALSPGPATLEVRTGALVVLDPELAPGAPAVWEWTANPLPATFALPDPGVGVDLFVDVVHGGDGEILAVFDDGRIERVVTPPGATRARVEAGARAREVTILGPTGTAVSVAMRGRIPGDERADVPLPQPSVDEALRGIEDATRRIDAGDTAARAERAWLLGSLGQLTAARRDLGALPADDPERLRVARAIANGLPSRPTAGPATAEAALAEAGVELVLPTEPADARARAIADAAASHPSPSLYAAAAQAWIEAGDGVRALDLALASGMAEVIDAAAGALTWRSIPSADRSAGLVPVPVVAGPAEPTLHRQVRAALLGSPWPATDTLVLRDDTVDVVRVQGEVGVDLLCRDEVTVGGGCRVPIRAGVSRRTVVLKDGETAALKLDARDLEIGGPGIGRAVVVRLTTSAGVLPPQAERLGIRVTQQAPARVRVAGGQALRVDVQRGSVTARVGDRAVSAVTGTSVRLPIVETAPVDLVVEGDGVVLLYAGTNTALPTVDPLAVVDTTIPETTPEWVDSVMDTFSVVRSPHLVNPSSLGTFRFAAQGFTSLDNDGDLSWIAGGPVVTWMRAVRRQWIQLRTWADAPSLTVGAYGQGGTKWGSGRVQASVDLAHAIEPAPAGHTVARLYVRQDARFSVDTGMRAELTAFAGTWSDAPDVDVNPHAWTEFNATHPVGLSPDASFVVLPFRDLRIRMGAKGSTNPDIVTFDRAGPYVETVWLIGNTTQVELTGQLQWRFADDYRDETAIRPSIDLVVDHMRWVSRTDRVGVIGQFTVLPAVSAVQGSIELRWELTGGRGLRDLPPSEETFRQLRERW